MAVKVLNVYTAARDEEALATILRRFSTEARAAAMIDHPNVVKIFDMGVIDALQLPYIVMELLNGHDLDVELDLGPMQPRRALGLVERCLEALAVGHDQGIIHKDLKPANIFLTHPGTEREDVRILDFGTARLQSQGAGLTAAGEVLGTPQYLAPEYISKQIVSPALDVYQMGLILVEMLTGAPVVQSDNSLACLMAHSSGELHIDGLLLQGELGRVLSGALEYDHSRRYSDAGDFLLALRAIDVARISIGGAPVRLSSPQARSAPSPGPRPGVEGASISSDDMLFGFESTAFEPARAESARTDPARTGPTREAPATVDPFESAEPRPSVVDTRPDWFSNDPFDFASGTVTAPNSIALDPTSAPAISAPATSAPRRADRPAPEGGDRRDLNRPAREDGNRRDLNRLAPEGGGRRDLKAASPSAAPASAGLRARSWLMPALAALALLVVIGGVGLALTWDRAPSGSPASQRPAGEIEARPGPVIKRPERRDDDRISVGLISEPTAATIKDGDELLGQTPMTLHLDPKRPRRKITISLEGHHTQTITITGADAPMKVVTLKP